MSVDLKTLTPDTSIADSAVLFGADSQASSTPSVYAVSTLRTHIVGTENTFTQPQIVSVNSASTAFRIIQTGAGNALVVEDSANPDSTPFVVNTDGRVLCGLTTPVTTLFSNSPGVQINAQFGVQALALTRYSANQFGADMDFVKSRNATPGSHTIVNSGDQIANLNFAGSDGTAFSLAASISASVDGAPAVGDVPGRIVFFTKVAGGTFGERMRITSAGRVGIGTTAPNVNLEVATSIRAFGSGGSYAQMNGGNVDGANIQLNRAGSASQNAFLGQFQGSLYLKNLDSGFIAFTTTTSDTERMRITSLGNVCIGTTAAGTSAEEVLAIGTGVAPTTGPADTIQIYSTDLSAGNTILSLYTEGTPVNANTTAAATHRIAVRINGTVYYLLANTAA